MGIRYSATNGEDSDDKCIHNRNGSIVVCSMENIIMLEQKKNTKEGKNQMNKPNQKNQFGRLLKLSFAGFAILILLMMSVYSVPAGHRGVVLTFGKVAEEVSDEGLHFKIPIMQRVKKIEVRIQKIEADADSASRDLQDVKTTVALNYHVIPDEANTLFQEIGLSYRERIINPMIQESVKAVTAKFTAEELVTRRTEVRSGIQEFLRARLLESNIIVDDLNIVNFQFSAEFDKAIEAKVTAEQLKLKAETDLERIKIEAEQTIASAQAEATSLQLQKAAITPDLIELRKIEVEQLAIEKWNGVL
ncbi:hypothetical protein LCGC14_2700200, partial [marine sediment metagenome]